MKIVGLDPGIAIVGWAIIETSHRDPHLIRCGAIESPKTDSMGDRLAMLFHGLETVIDQFRPDVASIEELYFSTNVKTAITVAEARGVLLLSLSLHKLPVVSYGPKVVKSVICGDGRADKKMVQTMITKILSLDLPPKPDDVADAVAIALTHAYQGRGTL